MNSSPLLYALFYLSWWGTSLSTTLREISFTSGEIPIWFLFDFYSGRTDLCFTVFFLVQGKWKDFLKVTLLVRAWTELRAESQVWTHGHTCWVTEGVSWQRTPIHFTTLPGSVSPFFPCRCQLLPSDLRVEGWCQGCQCGGESLTLPQLGPHVLQHPCSPLPGSAASHRPALVQFQTTPFALSHFFCQGSKSDMS